MKNLNSAKELKAMAQDMDQKSVAELELLAADVRGQIRTKMIEALVEGDCQVIFKKVSGEERTMLCTLNEDHIPKASQSDPLSQKKVRAVNEEVIPVWDVTAEGWRSFRVDSVISFSPYA